MYLIEEKFLSDLLRDHSKSIVGRLCKQNELISDNISLSNDNDKKLVLDALALLKSFNRELIYETSRDFKNQIRCYSKGKNYEKYKLYDPTNQ